VELATVLAGPGAGRYLADYGANVIKIEAPSGDPSRRMGWTGPDEEDSYFWKLINRNKSVASLDLKAKSGKDLLWSILTEVDVLIENMRPGKLAKLGYSAEELLKRNPKLVILRVTGFGQTGPYAMHPGFATIAEALSGFAGLLGEEDGPPLLPPIAITDELTAIVGAFSVMVALRHAERTGEGQEVDVNLLASMFQIMGPLPSAYAHMGYLQPRMGSGIPYSVPRGTYRCSDGVWVAISSSAESIANRVLNMLGLTGDMRFSDFQSRAKNRDALEEYVIDWVKQRPFDQVVAEFRAADAAIAKVLDMKDIFADEHYSARGMIKNVDGVMMQDVIAGFSKTPGTIRHAGRKLNSDSEKIFGEFKNSPQSCEQENN